MNLRCKRLRINSFHVSKKKDKEIKRITFPLNKLLNSLLTPQVRSRGKIEQRVKVPDFLFEQERWRERERERETEREREGMAGMGFI